MRDYSLGALPESDVFAREQQGDAGLEELRLRMLREVREANRRQAPNPAGRPAGKRHPTREQIGKVRQARQTGRVDLDELYDRATRTRTALKGEVVKTAAGRAIDAVYERATKRGLFATF